MARWLLFSGVAAPLAGCAPRIQLGAASRVRLAPVRVDERRVIREVAGLRPFRRSGFRVEVVSLGDRILVHNYGHGGGGISLSWGTADMAARLARETPHRNVAVIGCGAVGLASARLLQDRGFDVTIYARDLPPNTTSNVAGAQWAPFTVVDADRRTADFDSKYVAASRFAYRYFQNLAGPEYGVFWRDQYFLSEGPRAATTGERALLDDLIPIVDLPADEHPFTGLRAGRMLSMHIEPATYLTAVLRDFRIAGGNVIVREFPDARNLMELEQQVIVNCTGLGSASLFGDSDMLPIKGQLVVLAPQPEVDYITIGPAGLYMMPRRDGIVLGGTFQRGDWSLEPDPIQSQRILAGNRSLFARLT